MVGAFCSACGQKVHFESEPTVHEFFHEIVHEFLHLDGKIFKTLRVLFTQPGQLTKELLNGRRASYVGPIRLYLSVSVVMFLLAATFQPDSHVEAKPTQQEAAEETLSSTDSVLLALLSKKQIQKVDQFNVDHPRKLQEFATHSNAKIFFILVPLFALLLQWSFGARRKNYISYLYFSLHFHAFVFGAGYFIFLFFLIDRFFATKTILIAEPAWYLVGFTYNVLALRNVWGDSLVSATLRTAGVAMTYVVFFFLTIMLFVLGYVNYHAGA